jgi:hypothetical protein
MSHKLDIILLQETMVEGLKAKALVEPWLKNWSFYTLDAVGQSRGLLTGWSPVVKSLSVSLFNSAISIQLEVKDLGLRIFELNIYEPYVDCIPFWENLSKSKALDDPFTLIDGDLILTLSEESVAGQPQARFPEWLLYCII